MQRQDSVVPQHRQLPAQPSNHGQTKFYNSDATILVIVSSESGTADGVAKTRSVAYERYQPAFLKKQLPV
jgi:hypothetical protein